MGIPGPCGPCSELYYDRGPDYGREGGPEVDEDRYMEFWNLVFMQNVRGPGTSKDDYPILGELPAKNIDTGMGMERMAALLQGVDNLYEIDETRPVLARAAELTGKIYGAHSGHAASESHPDDVRLRVIADHVPDGVDADRRRRDARQRGPRLRAASHHPGARCARCACSVSRARAARVAARVARLHGAVYPELATDFERISTYAYAEEEAFLSTLRAGTTIFDIPAVSDLRRWRTPRPCQRKVRSG